MVVGDQLLDYASNAQLPIVAYSILLNGAYSRADRPVPRSVPGPDTDARLAALHAVSTETGATLAQVVIAWLRHHPQQIIPIIGGSTLDRSVRTSPPPNCD